MQGTVGNYQTRKTLPSKQAFPLRHGLVNSLSFQTMMNSLSFTVVGKYNRFSPELMLFCFDVSDETVKTFWFGCSVTSITLEYL